MQCIQQLTTKTNNINNNLATTLNNAIFQPISQETKTLIAPLMHCCGYCAQVAKSTTEKSLVALNADVLEVGKSLLPARLRLALAKLKAIGQLKAMTATGDFNANKNTNKPLIYLASALMFALPSKSLTSFEGGEGLQKIALTGSLVVAIPKEQLFVNDLHRHGFGLDNAKRYAEYLGANLIVHPYDSEEEALTAIESGKADLMVGNHINYSQSDIDGLLVSCGNVDLSTYGLSPDTNFALKNSNKQMLTHVQNYLCQSDTMASTTAMAKFYEANGMNAYSQAHFDRAIKERLPAYKKAFQKQADKYNYDWQLLAAISYQESHFKADAISPTGVQGIMMLTNATAAAMGVSDRTNAMQSIQGGAKYLGQLKENFAHIPEDERLWFVLAAYNMGPNAVKSIQKQLSEQGKDPNLWSNFYSYLSVNAKKNSRYVQCMHYVTNIRSYLELLGSDEIA